jgi:hypothetical protein
MRFQEIDNNWFYTELKGVTRLFLFFIRGDLVVLLPLFVGVLLLGFFSLKFMIIMLGVLFIVRYAGEMMYWFHHQFYDKKYRPDDFGFKNLDNNAIYILYQTFAIAGVVIGAGFIVAALMFMK